MTIEMSCSGKSFQNIFYIDDHPFHMVNIRTQRNM